MVPKADPVDSANHLVRMLGIIYPIIFILVIVINRQFHLIPINEVILIIGIIILADSILISLYFSRKYRKTKEWKYLSRYRITAVQAILGLCIIMILFDLVGIILLVVCIGIELISYRIPFYSQR